MRQKFLISQEGKNDDLRIRESAVIDKDLRRVDSAFLREDHYTVLCEETYDKGAITDAISKGHEAVVTALRTPNLFPAQPYCVKIAESVMALYASKTERSVELTFDDAEQVAAAAEALPE